MSAIPEDVFGLAGAACFVMHYLALTWLHFNVARKYDPGKDASVPKSFFTVWPNDNMDVLGFIFTAPRHSLPSAKAYGYVRLARFSLVLFCILAGFWMWNEIH